jgi:hypothetical protein
VERAILVNEIENSLHEGILLEVGENAQGDTVATEVRLIVGIAAGAAERAFPGNFNR